MRGSALLSGFADGGLSARVTRYGPGVRQAPHRDAVSRISITLEGGSVDQTGKGEARLSPGDILLKSNEVLHETRFSPKGSVIFSATLDDGECDELANGALRGQWRPVRTVGALSLGVSLLEAARNGDARSMRVAIADMLVAGEESCGAVAPVWAAQLRLELEARSLKDVDVAARARAAGVHPAHLSRLFRRAYGVSVTEHAQHHSVRRAIGAIASRASLADAAGAAGFYAQSHMNRAFRRVVGRTPDQCRRLYAG